VLLRLLISGQL